MKLIVAQNMKQKNLAAKLDVHSSTVSRLLNGETTISVVQLERLSHLTGIPVEQFKLDPVKFASYAHSRVYGIMGNMPFDGTQRSVHMAVTEQHRSFWPMFYEKHCGDYVLYNRLVKAEKPIVASFFQIKDLTSDGISFRIANPVNRPEQKTESYQYEGILYPASDFVYCFAEQVAAPYEIISMVFEPPRDCRRLQFLRRRSHHEQYNNPKETSELCA